MARHKNLDWGLPEGSPQGVHQPWAVHAAILMDIRDELRQLNMLAIAVVQRAMPGLLVPAQQPKTTTAKSKAKRRRK